MSFGTSDLTRALGTRIKVKESGRNLVYHDFDTFSRISSVVIPKLLSLLKLRLKIRLRNAYHYARCGMLETIACL